MVVCKPILVFYFGPNQTFGLGLKLGQSRTIEEMKLITSSDQAGTNQARAVALWPAESKDKLSCSY